MSVILYQFLRQQHLECEQIGISLTPPTRVQLQTMLQAYDGQLKKLFNTSGNCTGSWQ